MYWFFRFNTVSKALLDNIVTWGQNIIMSVAHNTLIKITIHGVEAHFITNKDEIQTDACYEEDGM